MTRAATWLALLLLAPLAPLAVPLAAQAQGAGVQYRLVITCPGPSGFSFSTESAPLGCPVRTVDGQDQMGDPSLAVDPFDPSNLIIASLHGSSGRAGCGAQGPTPKSRCGQVFTTFTSTDAGASWTDNPYVPPDRFGNSAWGETTAITVDPYGHAYVGSLYAEEDGGGAYTYTLVAQKFAGIQDINEEQFLSNGAYHAEYLSPVHDGNRISQMWFLFDPRTDNMTMVWSEQPQSGAAVPPSCETDLGHTTLGDRYAKVDGGTLEVSLWQEANGIPDLQTDATCPSNPDARSAVSAAASAPGAAARPSPGGHAKPAVPGLAGLATASPAASLGLAPGNSTTAQENRTATATNGTASPSRPARPPRAPDGRAVGTIGVAWTGIRVNDTYQLQRKEDAIGPCSASTNPVLSDGYLYVGCVADPSQGPFRWHPDTLPGTVELFRMDPSGGKPDYLGAAPLAGGHPKLGVRSDGRLALLLAGASDGQLQLDAAFGHYRNATRRIDWGTVTHYGDQVAKPNPSVRVTDAHVQDLLYREWSGVVHLILKQNVANVGLGVGSLEASLAPHIRKSIVALDEAYGLLWRHDLDVGNLLNRSSDPELLQADEAAYDDLTDDFLQLPEGNFTFDGQSMGDTYQREFFAVGDYGQLQFAELVEVTNLRGPAALPPNNPPPPNPAPAPSNTPATVLVPAAGLTVSTLMAVAFVLNRRKDKTVTLAKLKKK